MLKEHEGGCSRATICLRAYFKCVEHILTDQMRMKSLLTTHVHIFSTESVEPGLKKEDRQNTSEHPRPTH